MINRKDVILHQNNARRHTSLVIRQKLRELGWELLMHPPYSPDLAPPDYYLFLSLHNSLNGKTFDNDEAIKLSCIQFIAEKSQKFYERGIMNKAIEYIMEIGNNFRDDPIFLKNIIVTSIQMYLRCILCNYDAII